MLRVAKTEEKRERIKWFHARRLFFGFSSGISEGLQLAQQCNHEDARLLVSLFPEGAPDSRELVAQMFLENGDEPRCLFWAAYCGALPVDEVPDVMLRVAGSGYSWAQARYSRFAKDGAEKKAWLEKAAAQGETDALFSLAQDFYFGRLGGNADKRRGLQLWQEAAEMGHWMAQFEHAMHAFEYEDLQRFVWLRRSAMQGHRGAFTRMIDALTGMLRRRDKNRTMFEIGAAMAMVDYWRTELRNKDSLAAANEALKRYEYWCREAKRGVLCWIWLARQLKVAKDIRLMIADLIWERRSAWSETSVGWDAPVASFTHWD